MSITAKQQATFESMVSALATARKITRQLAIEILVTQLGGGAEKLAA
jgi:hypothetical protein